jgi:hypothetical protein
MAAEALQVPWHPLRGPHDAMIRIDENTGDVMSTPRPIANRTLEVGPTVMKGHTQQLADVQIWFPCRVPGQIPCTFSSEYLSRLSFCVGVYLTGIPAALG